MQAATTWPRTVAAAAGDNLAENGSGRGAGDTHPGEAEEAEDHDRVKNDIDNGTCSLGDHTVEGAAGGLQEPLKSDLENRAEGHAQDDPQIDRAVLLHQGILDLRPDERTRTEQADQQEKDIGQDGKEKAVVGGFVRAVKPLLSQGLGQEGIDTDACTCRERDQHILHGEGQGDCRQGILREPRDKHTVHDIVKSLHQHGYHHGQRHGDDQFFYRHSAHLVFSGLLHPGKSFPSKIRTALLPAVRNRYFSCTLYCDNPLYVRQDNSIQINFIQYRILFFPAMPE